MTKQSHSRKSSIGDLETVNEDPEVSAAEDDLLPENGEPEQNTSQHLIQEEGELQDEGTTQNNDIPPREGANQNLARENEVSEKGVAQNASQQQGKETTGGLSSENEDTEPGTTENPARDQNALKSLENEKGHPQEVTPEKCPETQGLNNTLEESHKTFRSKCTSLASLEHPRSSVTSFVSPTLQRSAVQLNPDPCRHINDSRPLPTSQSYRAKTDVHQRRGCKEPPFHRDQDVSQDNLPIHGSRAGLPCKSLNEEHNAATAFSGHNGMTGTLRSRGSSNSRIGQQGTFLSPARSRSNIQGNPTRSHVQKICNLPPRCRKSSQPRCPRRLHFGISSAPRLANQCRGNARRPSFCKRFWEQTSPHPHEMTSTIPCKDKAASISGLQRSVTACKENQTLMTYPEQYLVETNLGQQQEWQRGLMSNGSMFLNDQLQPLQQQYQTQPNNVWQDPCSELNQQTDNYWQNHCSAMNQMPNNNTWKSPCSYLNQQRSSTSQQNQFHGISSSRQRLHNQSCSSVLRTCSSQRQSTSGNESRSSRMWCFYIIAGIVLLLTLLMLLKQFVMERYFSCPEFSARSFYQDGSCSRGSK